MKYSIEMYVRSIINKIEMWTSLQELPNLIMAGNLYISPYGKPLRSKYQFNSAEISINTIFRKYNYQDSQTY